MRRLACFLLVSWAFAAGAATVSSEGDGTLVIDVPAGETYLHPSALTGAHVRKTGQGTVQFGTAATSFADAQTDLVGGVSVWPILTSTSAIAGTPEIDRATLPQPYALRFSDDQKTLYLLCPRGTVLTFR